MKTVVLDATPLGLLSNPRGAPLVVDCRLWADGLKVAGCRLVVPEVADYEVRRELIRSRKWAGLRLLDSLAVRYEYLPIHTAAFRRAAELWAVARQRGRPTAHPHHLDCDVLIAAQALELHLPNTVVATGNVAHLSQFMAAELWSAIAP